MQVCIIVQVATSPDGHVLLLHPFIKRKLGHYDHPVTKLFFKTFGPSFPCRKWKQPVDQ